MTRLPIQHATQSQAARRPAESLARMFIRNREELVTTRPRTRTRRDFLGFRLCALALARRFRVSCRRVDRIDDWIDGWFDSRRLDGPFTNPLPIPSTLLPTPFASVFRLPIPLARTPTTPPLGRFATGFAAIMRAGTTRTEQPFASLEQTPSGSRTDPIWPLVEPKCKMTLVHGSAYSRCASLGAKLLLRSEAFLPVPFFTAFLLRYFTKCPF